MKQFNTIFKFELSNFMKNKVFVGVTIFLVVLIAVVMFFPRLSSFFNSDSETVSEEAAPVMLVSDESGDSSAYLDYFAAAFSDYDVRYTEDDTDTIKEEISSGNAECAFVLTSGNSYKYYVDNLSMYDTNTVTADAVMKNIYQSNSMIEAGLSAEQAGSILSSQITHETESIGKDQVKNFFYTYIMIFALYMVVLMYGQMVATNVATEKSSRAMELLITSAKTTPMMFGKVIASCLAGLIQLVAVFGSSILFYNINKSYWLGNETISSIFDMPVWLLLYMLLFFALGFFLYAFMYGAVGSTVSKLEDINTAVMPVTMVFVIGFVVVMISMSSGNVDNTLMKVCSFIPFTSPMAMFTRIAMSTVPPAEIICSIAILAVSVVGIGVLAAKIYRAGVLMYGTKPNIGSILKTVFKKSNA